MLLSSVAALYSGILYYSLEHVGIDDCILTNTGY